jgi:hypothetical protein
MPQNKYVFPAGADASVSLNKYIGFCKSAGFEVSGLSIDTLGVHYSATFWRWYKNWLSNRDTARAMCGDRWYRVHDNATPPSLKPLLQPFPLHFSLVGELHSRSGSITSPVRP